MTKRLYRDLARESWSSDESPTCELLRTAGAVEAVKALDLVVERLDRIIVRLDNLGAEGLHFILRDEAKARRRRARQRAAKAAQKRRLTLARKKAAS